MTTPKSLGGGMGFRDLGLFNQAMLARQGWRIVTDPDSLCARVLKGRYFPNSDFWNAPKPTATSFTWHSILFGRDFLRKGEVGHWEWLFGKNPQGSLDTGNQTFDGETSPPYA